MAQVRLQAGIAVSLSAILLSFPAFVPPVQASIQTSGIMRGPEIEAQGQLGNARSLPSSFQGTEFIPRAPLQQTKGQAGDKQRALRALDQLQAASTANDNGDYSQVRPPGQ